MPITHTSNATLQFQNASIYLDNLLVVLNLNRNLLSVRYLTSSRSINCEFDNTDVNVLDRKTRKILIQGYKRGSNLYLLPTPVRAPKFISLLSSRLHLSVYRIKDLGIFKSQLCLIYKPGTYSSP